MAEIKFPMTAAMKQRARAAAEQRRPEVELSPRVKATKTKPAKDVVRGPDPNWEPNFSPREYRALILRERRDPATREAMRVEGWFEPLTGPEFRPESNTPVRLTKPSGG